MKFATVMISCEERNAVRAETLQRFRETDWPEPDDVIVSMHHGDHARPQARQTANALHALELGLRTNKPYILFLEDDLAFNRHIYHNLTNWPVLSGLAMGSLYNPNIRELYRRPHLSYFEADPQAVYGSQAYVLGRECVEFIVRKWGKVEGMQDIKISRLTAMMKAPIYYYVPSLVQHVGDKSTFGGGFHQTTHFDPKFKL